MAAGELLTSERETAAAQTSLSGRLAPAPSGTSRKDLYMGVDVVYTRLNTAYAGAAVSPFTTIYLGSSALDDQHVLSGIFRMQYNFAAGLEGPNVIFGR